MYTEKQIEKLLQNPNVVKCSKTNIKYSSKFKIWAVKKYYEEGYSPKMIFAEADFDLAMINNDLPKRCLRRWKKIYKEKGEELLKVERRGRKKKIVHKSVKEKIKYLEAKIAYLEEENDFLAKLRGFKRE